MNTDKRLTQTLHVRCTALSRYLSLRGFTAVHFSPKPVWQDGGKENVSKRIKLEGELTRFPLKDPKTRGRLS